MNDSRSYVATFWKKFDDELHAAGVVSGYKISTKTGRIRGDAVPPSTINVWIKHGHLPQASERTENDFIAVITALAVLQGRLSGEANVTLPERERNAWLKLLRAAQLENRKPPSSSTGIQPPLELPPAPELPPPSEQLLTPELDGGAGGAGPDRDPVGAGCVLQTRAPEGLPEPRSRRQNPRAIRRAAVAIAGIMLVAAISGDGPLPTADMSPVPSGPPDAVAKSKKRRAEAGFYRARNQILLKDTLSDGHTSVLVLKIDGKEKPSIHNPDGQYRGAAGGRRELSPGLVIDLANYGAYTFLEFRACASQNPPTFKECGPWVTAPTPATGGPG